MSFVRGRQSDFAGDRFRSFTNAGANPPNLVSQVPLLGGIAIVLPRVIFSLAVGFQSFFWSGVNPANVVNLAKPPQDTFARGRQWEYAYGSEANKSFVRSGVNPVAERTELYRVILTQQQLPLNIPRGFAWAGNQPANISPASPMPLGLFSRMRVEFAYGEAGKSFLRSGNQPANVAPQAPLFGTNLLTRPTDVSTQSTPVFTWPGLLVNSNVIPGSIAGVFYWQDEGEKHYYNRSFVSRGLVYQEINHLDEVKKIVLQQDRVVFDLIKGFQSFVQSGVIPNPVFPEVYRSILTVQQKPLDIQRSYLWPGQIPIAFIPETPITTRTVFVLPQIPIAHHPGFTFNRVLNNNEDVQPPVIGISLFTQQQIPTAAQNVSFTFSLAVPAPAPPPTPTITRVFWG